MDRRTLLNLFLGLLMASAMLANLPIGGAQLLAVSPAHLAAVQNEPGQDAGAPYGTWSKAIERVSWYLHRDEKFNVSETPVGADTLNNDRYYLDYERPKATIVDLATFPAVVNVGQPILEDYRDLNDKKVTVTSGPRNANVAAGEGPLDNPARFVIPVPLTQTEDIKIYGYEVDFWARCQSAVSTQTDEGGLGTMEFRVYLDLLKNVNGAWVREDYGNPGQQPFKVLVVQAPSTSAGAATAGVQRFTGSLTFGNPEIGQTDSTNTALNALLVRAPTATDPGNRLQFSFLPANNAGNCILHFDTSQAGSNSAGFPSKIILDSDSARLNTWVENREGGFTQGLPTPSRASATERNFFGQVIHASAWPKFNGYFNPRTDVNTAGSATTGVAPATNDDNTPVDYQDDFWDLTDSLTNPTPGPGPGAVVQASDLRIRIRDMVTLGLVQGTTSASGTLSHTPEQVLQVSRDVKRIGDGVNRIEYRYLYPSSLPERQYRLEAFSTQHGVAVSPTVGFGLKGFTVTALDNLTHLVNPGQHTEFRFRIKNIGAEDDTVTAVANPAGSSWESEIVGGSSHFLKAFGGEAEVVLRVTPPSTATVGTSQVATFTASSANFANEVPPVLSSANVTVVSAVTRGVDITSTENLVLMSPGVDTAIAGVRVRNLGTSSDLIGVTPVLPASAVGWTAQVTPLSRNMPAASSGDFAVRIRAPVDAPAGQTFLLGLVAQRLGDSSVSDRVDLTITVQVKHSFLLELLEAPIDMRDQGCSRSPDSAEQFLEENVFQLIQSCSSSETDVDYVATHRLTIHNSGPVTDTYTLTSTWLQDGVRVGTQVVDDIAGTNACDGELWPDGWRYIFGNATQVGAGLGSSGTPNLKTQVSVPGRTSSAFYVALGYRPDITAPSNNCGNSASPINFMSPAGGIDLTAVSKNDPGLSQKIRIAAYITPSGAELGANDYAGGIHAASVEADLTDLDRVAVAQPGTSATHLVRVVNRGNERDNFVVQVPASGDGWTKQLEFVSGVPSNVVCSSLNPANNRFVCPLGILDEALFKFVVTPSAAKATGLTDRSLVSVISGDDGRVGDSLEFATSTVGTFQFAGQVLDPIHDAERGRTALLPFVLRNIGTQADTLNLSISIGNADWQPRIGLPTSTFVPAGRDAVGFLSVIVPANATANEPFRLQVSSQGNGVIQNLEFTVRPVAPSVLQLAGIPSNTTTLPQTGVPVNITVQVTDTQGAANRTVTVTPAAGALPLGWNVSPASRDVLLQGGAGTAVFAVTAPNGALSSSRVPFIVRASSAQPTALAGQADLLLQLADTFGVRLELDGLANQTITPGGEVVFGLKISNLGTSTDSVRIATAGAPTGWLVQANPPELSLGPLETRSLSLLVRAPVAATPRTTVNTTIQATSLGGSSVSVATVLTTVGFNQINVAGSPGIPELAPNEKASFVYTVTNNGTLPDEIVVAAVANSSALANFVTITPEPASVKLDPGQSKGVRIDVALRPNATSGSTIEFALSFTSMLDAVVPPTQQNATASVRVVRFVNQDADHDGVNEYAIDRDENAGNGYEEFADSTPGGGKATRVANLTGFLSDEARASFTRQVTIVTDANGTVIQNATSSTPGNRTTVEVFDFLVDGDNDGRVDFLLDSTGDSLPDQYWDPDRGAVQDLNVYKDVNGDSVPEYFIDSNGDGAYDSVYDLRQGKFIPLLQLDVDGDGELDYVIDANENGRLDANETILYSRTEGLITVRKLDVDGDGKLDDVFDTNGDGQPDFFIPAGSETPIEIVLDDANGDGVADWTFDSNGDGRVDSYYDPTSGDVNSIDGPADFVDALRNHWYIGALFALVLVLFVALIAVTRR